MGRERKIGLLCMALAIVPAVARASSTAQLLQPSGHTGSSLAWAGGAYQNCDHSCLKQKALENLSQYAITLRLRINKMTDAIAREPFEDDKMRILRANSVHCLKGDSSTDCFDRFRDFQERQIAEIRAQMMEYKIEISRLGGTDAQKAIVEQSVPQRAVDGPAAIAAEKDRAGKKPQVTTVPDFEEAKALYSRETQHLEFVSSQQYQDWADGLPKEPSKSAYVLFKKKTGSGPSDNPSYDFDRSCGKEICYDEKAYDKAKRLYAAKKQKFDADLSRMFAEGLPNRRPAEMDETSVGRETYDSYNDTQRLIVDTVERSRASLNMKNRAASESTAVSVSADPEDLQ